MSPFGGPATALAEADGRVRQGARCAVRLEVVFDPLSHYASHHAYVAYEEYLSDIDELDLLLNAKALVSLCALWRPDVQRKSSNASDTSSHGMVPASVKALRA